MKSSMFSFLAIAVLLAAGCGRESEKGGPGATDTKKNTKDGMTSGTPNDKQTFTLTVPSIKTGVTQGTREEVEVSIDRGSDFTQKVTLTFDAPQGLSVDPPTATIEGGKEETHITVVAAQTATPGDTNIKVMATPETGKAVDAMLPVTVKTP